MNFNFYYSVEAAILFNFEEEYTYIGIAAPSKKLAIY